MEMVMQAATSRIGIEQQHALTAAPSSAVNFEGIHHDILASVVPRRFTIAPIIVDDIIGHTDLVARAGSVIIIAVNGNTGIGIEQSIIYDGATSGIAPQPDPGCADGIYQVVAHSTVGA